MVFTTKNGKLRPIIKAVTVGAFALLVLVILQGPRVFFSWFTGNFLLYVAAFFFLWPTARAISGQQMLNAGNVISIVVGLAAWLFYAGMHSMNIQQLLESLFMIVFIVSFLYAPFASINKKIAFRSKKNDNWEKK